MSESAGAEPRKIISVSCGEGMHVRFLGERTSLFAPYSISILVQVVSGPQGLEKTVVCAADPMYFHSAK